MSPPDSAAAVASPQPALQDLVRRAVDAAAVPIGWIAFLDGRRERVEARVGVGFTELAQDRSFALRCGALDGPRFVEDASRGEWSDHPLVAGEPRARFVGVVPLVSREGHVLGALTVLDPQPRAMRREERTALANLASLAVARVEAMGQTPAERRDEESRKRREAERLLAEERAFSEAVLENLSGAFLLVSPEG